jgi:thiol:disulfide interchange protein
MSSKSGLPLARQVSSRLAIWIVSVSLGLALFGLAIFLQWLIYDDWMHDAGPVRLVGSLLAGALMCAVVFRWQIAVRQRRLEMLRRFETIRWMNDRIRNSLQAIECVTYHANPEATDSVRSAVDAIESVLQEVLSGAHAPAAPSAPQRPSLTVR